MADSNQMQRPRGAFSDESPRNTGSSLPTTSSSLPTGSNNTTVSSDSRENQPGPRDDSVSGPPNKSGTRDDSVPEVPNQSSSRDDSVSVALNEAPRRQIRFAQTGTQDPDHGSESAYFRRGGVASTRRRQDGVGTRRQQGQGSQAPKTRNSMPDMPELIPIEQNRCMKLGPGELNAVRQHLRHRQHISEKRTRAIRDGMWIMPIDLDQPPHIVLFYKNEAIYLQQDGQGVPKSVSDQMSYKMDKDSILRLSRRLRRSIEYQMDKDLILRLSRRLHIRRRRKTGNIDDCEPLHASDPRAVAVMEVIARKATELKVANHRAMIEPEHTICMTNWMVGRHPLLRVNFNGYNLFLTQDGQNLPIRNDNEILELSQKPAYRFGNNTGAWSVPPWDLAFITPQDGRDRRREILRGDGPRSGALALYNELNG